MKKLFDLDDPFFRPLWLRVLIVAFAGGWGLFEFASGQPFWGILFCAIGAYAFYGFFVAFNPRETEEKNTKPENKDG